MAKHPLASDKNANMKYAFRLDSPLWLVSESLATDGYVVSARDDTEARQPKANMLPTRADEADDMP